MKKLRLFLLTISFIACLCCETREAKPPDIKSVAHDYIPKLEKNLRQNIVPFWLQKTLDPTNGGYTINFGLKSEPLGPGVKMIVTQARQVWLFSRLVREGYGGKKCQDAAGLGYRFLKEKMWDKKHGGFYWQVDATGNKVLLAGKIMYGQTFGLYAVAEYYLACKKPEALTFAREIFELMEAKAHDSMYGGYCETFAEDWTIPTLTRSYLGTLPDTKTMNTHLHLLEAMTSFYRASALPLARERLLELLHIQSTTVVRKNVGACTDKYQRDWTPMLDGENAQVAYGHSLENIWLLIDACDAAGISPSPLRDLFQVLFNYALKYGVDEKKGGFYRSGNIVTNRVTDRNKVWWVQAEALVCSLYLYRLTQDTKYLEVFARTYDFIDVYQVDWHNGEWYATITPKENPEGNKADQWKAGYHNGRAMIECLTILKKAQ
jgi:cellobiose epimerase